MKKDIHEEENFYSEELGQTDWKYLKDSSEVFLEQAYSHMLQVPQN